MITKEDVIQVQKQWADAIIAIGQMRDKPDLCQKETSKLLDKLYAFENGNILFKPTKASQTPFRFDKDATQSYFISANPNFPEDRGFALKPWVKVNFENANFILDEKRAIVMGNYSFTDRNNIQCKAEFTFAYVLTKENRLKIDVHHSSFSYKQ